MKDKTRKWYCLKCSLQCKYCHVNMNTSNSVVEQYPGHFQGVFRDDVTWNMRDNDLVCVKCASLYDNNQICKHCNKPVCNDIIIKLKETPAIATLSANKFGSIQEKDG